MAKKNPLIRVDFKNYIVGAFSKIMAIIFYLCSFALIAAVIKATHFI